MYRYINANVDRLVKDPKLERAVRDYAALTHRLQRTDVSTDSGFQRTFRVFWALNAARRPDHWLKVYFELLESHKTNRDVDVVSLVHELASRTRPDAPSDSLQFSFASKLAHMANAHLPIYDNLIASFYFFNPPGGWLPFEGRLRRLESFYAFLKEEYSRVMSCSLLDHAMWQFRATHARAAAFTDVKVLDFLLWTYVRALRGTAQQEGGLLFD